MILTSKKGLAGNCVTNLVRNYWTMKCQDR